MNDPNNMAAILSRFDALDIRLQAINDIQEERRMHLDTLVRNLHDDMYGKHGSPGVKMAVDRLTTSEKARQQITLGTVVALIGLIIHSVWDIIAKK